MDGIRIRDFEPGRDEEPLRRMIAEAFAQDRSPELWRWKYRDNPAGPAVIVLAESGGAPVSAAFALPLRMRVLDVQTAQDTAAGVGHVVLQERLDDANLGVAGYLPGFHEPAAFITVNHWFDQQYIRYCSCLNFHRIWSFNSASKYWP